MRCADDNQLYEVPSELGTAVIPETQLVSSGSWEAPQTERKSKLRASSESIDREETERPGSPSCTLHKPCLQAESSQSTEIKNEALTCLPLVLGRCQREPQRPAHGRKAAVTERKAAGQDGHTLAFLR